MSRSVKKYPGYSPCSTKGQKKYKKAEHKSERRTIKTKLSSNKELLPHPKEYGNEWTSPRDGKCYANKQLIKDFPKILRK